jgi:hypothetical protein
MRTEFWWRRLRNFEDLDVDRKIILKLILTRIEGYGSDPSGSGDGPAMGCCE